MTSQLKKYLFRSHGLMIIFFLLLLAGTLAAQKRNFTIKPDHIKIQYAGGTGFMALGAGYSNKNQKLEADFYYGYLPKDIGGVSIHSISAKFIWIPIHPIKGKKLWLEPLMTGIVANYSFGDQYFTFDPPHYPYRYYSFPTSIHTALLLGSRIGTNFPQHTFMKSVSFYYELLGFDRDIISLASNPKSLHLTEVISLSLGIKVKIE